LANGLLANGQKPLPKKAIFKNSFFSRAFQPKLAHGQRFLLKLATWYYTHEYMMTKSTGVEAILRSVEAISSVIVRPKS
jgi:hypothetical protein